MFTSEHLKIINNLNLPVALGKQTRRVRFDMVYPCILIIAVFILLYWLLKINKEYYVLAFFARRARATDGRSVDNIAPILKGNTIFGNVFDLYGKNDGNKHKKICMINLLLNILF